jgi:hypothetical protein
MASTEVMRAGVRVAVAFLLSEISTLLEKGEEKRSVCVRNWIRKRNQLSAFSIPILMKELASEDREFHKNHLRMSNHTSCGLYKSLVPTPLFFDFTFMFTSWLFTVFIIFIFLPTQYAVNYSLLNSASNFFMPFFSRISVAIVYLSLSEFPNILYTLKMSKYRHKSTYHSFCERSQ